MMAGYQELRADLPESSFVFPGAAPAELSSSGANASWPSKVNSSSVTSNVQIPLSFIIDCFNAPLKKYINVKDLGDCLISTGLLDGEEFGKVRKYLETHTETETVTYLFERVLQEKITDKEADIEDGGKFMSALNLSANKGVLPHKILAHYIEGSIHEIPALTDTEQKFREALREHLHRLTAALDSPDLIGRLIKHTGSDEAQRLLKRRELRYLDVYLTLNRNPGRMKEVLLDHLRQSGFSVRANYLEERSQLSDSNETEIDENDVRSYCSSFDSMDQDLGDMSGNLPGRWNSHQDQFHSTEAKSSSLMDYQRNIDDGEPMLKSHISSSKMETDQMEDMKQTPAGPSQKGGITLRPYQQELLYNAIKGFNTVILAPTNAGKTVVAGKIIQKHFSNCMKKKPKVAFIVEKKALADQQEEAIKKFLDQGSAGHSNMEVGKITGDTIVPDIEMMIDQLDIVVTTAGALSSDHRAVTDQTIAVSRFSLMIFDECHHCQKSHPYNRLMRMYRQEKKEQLEEGQSDDILPQVIGLTATLGAGKGSRTTDKAIEHALTILANLNADKIETVSQEKDSLARFVNIPVEVSPVYVERRVDDPVADRITALMMENETMLMNLPDYHLLPPVPNVTPKDRKEYEQWVITTKEKHCPERVHTGANRKRLMVCLEHLIIYYKALCVNRDARSKDACGFMREKLDHLWEDRENLIQEQWQSQQSFYAKIKEMERLTKKPEYSNPLLVELEELVLKDFRREPKSRALLFTDRIETTQYLSLWIAESPKMRQVLKPCKMTSETSEPQRKSLNEKFKSGEYNFMIVTSVVEEGIDIGACNLVYRLNYVPSDCGRIQQKGRIRAKNGRSYFVCYGNLKQNELVAKMMEKLMAQAVLVINRYSDQELQEHLRRYQRKDDRMQEEDTRKRRLREQSRDTREYLLCCKKCGLEACQSSDIKRYNKSQHYVCSQQFCDEKIDIKPHPKPNKIDDMYKVGKVYCIGCGKDWGILAKLEESRFPVLKIDPFVVYELKEDNSRGKPLVLKKWIQAPFTVEDVNEVEENLTYDIDFETWA